MRRVLGVSALELRMCLPAAPPADARLDSRYAPLKLTSHCKATTFASVWKAIGTEAPAPVDPLMLMIEIVAAAWAEPRTSARLAQTIAILRLTLSQAFKRGQNAPKYSRMGPTNLGGVGTARCAVRVATGSL